MVEPKEPQLRALLDYWDGKRDRRSMPARADLDPVEIPDLLPHVALVDTAESLAEFRYRLFGTELCKGFGHDRTGLQFAELPRLENFDEIYRGYWLTFTEKAPQYFHGQIDSDENSHIRYARLTLPLSADGEHINMILGCIIFLFGDEPPT